MKFLLLPGFLFFSLYLDAQFTIEWQKQLGGTNSDQVSDVLQTADGGYMILGTSRSNDGDVSGNHKADLSDAWLVKLAPDGAIEWQKCYGGSKDDYGFRIRETKDGGYVFTGATTSIDGDLPNTGDGSSDCWVVKIDSKGAVQWSRTYASLGNGQDTGRAIYPTEDDGYVVAGNKADSYWIFKMDAIGKKVWEHIYGGSGFEQCSDMCPTTDKGYILVGSSWSGNVPGHHGAADFPDYLVVKTDSLGKLQWEKSLGGSYLEQASDIIQTPDNGYVVIGDSWSNDGNVGCHHGTVGDSGNPWLVKLSSTGGIQWQECLGANENDGFRTLSMVSDGQFLLAGTINSPSISLGGAWLVKKSQDGATAWQARFGGSLDEGINKAIQTLDGGVLFVGYTRSTDGDVSVPAHSLFPEDIWVVKLAVPTSATESETNTLQLYPNPATTSVTLTGDANDPVLVVTIADVLGRPLLDLAVGSSGELPLTGLPAGAYLLSGQTKGGKTRCGKLIKL